MADEIRAPYVKCPGCGAMITVPLARRPEKPSDSSDHDQRFELNDCRGGGRLIFAWRELSGSLAGKDALETGHDITLEFPKQITATAGLPTDISVPLIDFIDQLAALDGDWNEERTLRDADRQFAITCSGCYRGEITFDVSLGAEFQDPAWTVELSLRVRQSVLPDIVSNLRRFFSKNGTSARSEDPLA